MESLNSYEKRITRYLNWMQDSDDFDGEMIQSLEVERFDGGDITIVCLVTYDGHEGFVFEEVWHGHDEDADNEWTCRSSEPTCEFDDYAPVEATRFDPYGRRRE